MTYKQYLAVAFRNWTLEHCKWVFEQTGPYFDQAGQKYQSTLPTNIAKYVALKKYGVELAKVKS